MNRGRVIEIIETLGIETSPEKDKNIKRIYLYTPENWNYKGKIICTIYTYSNDPQNDEGANWYIHNHTKTFDTESEIPVPEENILTFFELLMDYIKKDLELQNKLIEHRSVLIKMCDSDKQKEMIRTKKLESL